MQELETIGFKSKWMQIYNKPMPKWIERAFIKARQKGHELTSKTIKACSTNN